MRKVGRHRLGRTRRTAAGWVHVAARRGHAAAGWVHIEYSTACTWLRPPGRARPRRRGACRPCPRCTAGPPTPRCRRGAARAARAGRRPRGRARAAQPPPRPRGPPRGSAWVGVAVRVAVGVGAGVAVGVVVGVAVGVGVGVGVGAGVLLEDPPAARGRACPPCPPCPPCRPCPRTTLPRALGLQLEPLAGSRPAHRPHHPYCLTTCLTAAYRSPPPTAHCLLPLTAYSRLA